jgi:hypothetical protein
MSNNTVKLSIYKEETDEEGTFDAEIEVEFPAKWEICQRCEGDGHHSNPSIDGNGITSSEWAEWDDEEKDTYMSGGYDIPCEAKCSGGKALVVDTENLNDEQKKDYNQELKTHVYAEWKAVAGIINGIQNLFTYMVERKCVMA